MNECLKLRGGNGIPNVCNWVSAAAKLAAGVDQLTPFLSKGVNGGFS